jgi:hypothetical protein
MVIRVKKDILWFQIPVNNISRVQVLKSQNKFSDEVTTGFDGERFDVLDKR